MKCNNCREHLCIKNYTIVCEKCDKKFEYGTRVCHKSNSKIVMIFTSINSLNTDTPVVCTWIDHIGNHHKEYFKLSEIELCQI